MENKNLAIAITIATILLCGLPGLMSLCIGVLVAVDGPFPEEPRAEWILSFSLLCTGVFFLILPIIASILTFRRRTPGKSNLPQDEPIPPPN